MEVYQRRENLHFFEIKEEKDVNEDTREVLVDFLKTELGVGHTELEEDFLCWKASTNNCALFKIP